MTIKPKLGEGTTPDMEREIDERRRCRIIPATLAEQNAWLRYVKAVRDGYNCDRAWDIYQAEVCDRVSRLTKLESDD